MGIASRYGALGIEKFMTARVQKILYSVLLQEVLILPQGKLIWTPLIY